jgi:hypothetical protein
MTKGLDDGVRRKPYQVAKMLELRMPEVGPETPDFYYPLHPDAAHVESSNVCVVLVWAKSNVITDCRITLCAALQLLALEREAMSKLNKALAPILPEILACFRVSHPPDRFRGLKACLAR